jgi:hypothetical protein
MHLASSALLLACLAWGCGSIATTSTSSADVAGCSPGAALVGASYDLGKSRFAFGSTPVRDDSNGIVRWVGAHGVVAIEASGAEMGIMNAGAPETSLPDWSADPSTLAKHVTEYFVTMGALTCQVSASQILGGSGGRTVGLVRGADGILVAESNAFARLNTDDQSTSEGFYWPEVGADVVDAARAFRDRLAIDAGLVAYKAKLPANAQEDGHVVIHHTSAISSAAFHAATSYDVVQSSPEGGLARQLSFDADGNPTSTNW